MKTKIFVDSSFWIALFDESDSSHPKANKFSNEKPFRYLLFSSDYVLDECLTRLKKKTGAEDVFNFYESILKKKNKKTLTILQTTRRIFNRAYKIFKNNPTLKTFSFTDASIVALMKTHQIKGLLTFDQDFKKIRPNVQVLP